jgi:hypothetical protein
MPKVQITLKLLPAISLKKVKKSIDLRNLSLLIMHHHIKRGMGELKERGNWTR